MRPAYEPADIDTTSALRRAGAVQESFVSFTNVRALTSGEGTLTTGTRAAKPGSAALNDFYYETDTFWLYYWAGAAWKFLAGVNVGTDATRAAITVTANDNGAEFYTSDTGLFWRVEGGAWADKTASAARTGWTTDPTGTLNRTTFVSDTVLLPDLAARVAALIVDLRTKELIKA